MADLRIGLTGNIACGKSAAGAAFAKLGAYVIDADAIAHRCLLHNHPACGIISNVFGKTVSLPDGSIDRKALGRIVFADPSKKRDLESIIWPYVFDEVKKECNGACGIAVWEASQIIEAMDAGFSVMALYDKLVLVRADSQVQRERLRRRNGYSDHELDERIGSQLSQNYKATKANFIVWNNGSLDELDANVLYVWKRINP